MARVRKAFVAGGGAALAAFFTALVKGGVPEDAAGWGGLVGASAAVGFAAGAATWRVPNTPALKG